MNRTIIFTLGTTMALAMGCAHSPTHELVAARSTYAEAKQGPAGEIAKAEVYDAKKALDDAERAHREKPESDKERDLAYVALRKADYANVHAQLLQYRSQNADAHAKYVATLEQLKSSAETQLDSTSQELAAKEKDLAREREVREHLQQQLGAAMASIADMAKLEQKDQRMVITLNGAVLFKSDDTKLLPIAQQKLGQVAEVLKQYGDDYTITVAGHTDSRGSDAHNMTLSQGRADSVRAYLVGKGVGGNSITAIGKGEGEPVASNDTAEGRADNRRVEIIVDRNATPAEAK